MSISVPILLMGSEYFDVADMWVSGGPVSFRLIDWPTRLGALLQVVDQLGLNHEVRIVVADARKGQGARCKARNGSEVRAAG